MSIIWMLLIQAIACAAFVGGWVGGQKFLDLAEHRSPPSWQVGLGILILVLIAFIMAGALLLIVVAPIYVVVGWFG